MSDRYDTEANYVGGTTPFGRKKYIRFSGQICRW